MIDLGLPSGTLWACCNVGAAMPEGYGNYYAWGETKTRNNYSDETYQHGYYLNDFGHIKLVIIGSDIAGTQYDAATVNWGVPWRMPTRAQCKEFSDNCTSVWTTQNSVNGRKFIGPNGGTIFIPAAGNCWKGESYDLGSKGSYWSSTLDETITNFAWDLEFRSDHTHFEGQGVRSLGQSVRPVR